MVSTLRERAASRRPGWVTKRVLHTGSMRDLWIIRIWSDWGRVTIWTASWHLTDMWPGSKQTCVAGGERMTFVSCLLAGSTFLVFILNSSSSSFVCQVLLYHVSSVTYSVLCGFLMLVTCDDGICVLVQTEEFCDRRCLSAVLSVWFCRFDA